MFYDTNKLLELADKLESAAKDASGQNMFKKTVIVHPQVAKTNEEASEMSSSWEMRERKQLMENLEKILMG